MKRYRFISILIIMILLVNLSSTIVLAQDSVPEVARKQGESIGYHAGYIKGLLNYSNKLNIPYYEARPKESEIYSENSNLLIGKDSTYRAYFYIGYIEGFDRGYQETMGLATPGGTTGDVKTNYAEALGQTLGEIYGFRDFYNKVNSNWARALPTNTEIIRMYNLNMETSAYRSSFLSSFREKFKEGYEEGYEKANLEPKKITMESGISDGETIGQILGNIYGTKDYYEGKVINYLRNMPRDNVIQIDYSLNKDDREYKDGFLIGFKRAYEESYNSSFREANINTKLLNEMDAYDNGRAAGLDKGDINGTKDFMEKRPNDWRKHPITSSMITSEYNLIYQTAKYRQGFISGFWDGFAEGYTTTYKSLSQGLIGEKSMVEIIPMSGGVVASKDQGLVVGIERGTYYNDIALSIETLSDNAYVTNKDFIKSSKFYKIGVSNSSKDLNNTNNIQLSFEYYGGWQGGIYKRVNNTWMYLPSTIKEGSISTEVKPNSVKSGGNVYGVFIDKKAPLLTDIRSHWAKDEITAYVRRGIIKGYDDKTYKPERMISRGEFLILLSRLYNWQLPQNVDNISKFKDYQSFGNRDKIISYSLSKGYIMGYDDNTFKPNNPISYREVQTIMRRVLNDENFQWYNVSAKMLHEKLIKSSSYNAMDNKITRAEVAYMLYILNEWRY